MIYFRNNQQHFTHKILFILCAEEGNFLSALTTAQKHCNDKMQTSFNYPYEVLHPKILFVLEEHRVKRRYRKTIISNTDESLEKYPIIFSRFWQNDSHFHFFVSIIPPVRLFVGLSPIS